MYYLCMDRLTIDSTRERDLLIDLVTDTGGLIDVFALIVAPTLIALFIRPFTDLEIAK